MQNVKGLSSQILKALSVRVKSRGLVGRLSDHHAATTSSNNEQQLHSAANTQLVNSNCVVFASSNSFITIGCHASSCVSTQFQP